MREGGGRLKGRVAIVTGGAQGIGKATALVLSWEGASMVIPDVNLEGAEAVAGEIRSRGREALALGVDVSKGGEVREMTAKTLDRFGRIDILVNNAGIGQCVAFADLKEEDWDRVMDVNLKGVYLCSQAVMDTMIEQGWGRIINLASQAGKTGGLLIGAHYSASKSGVICLTKTLASLLAPHNITVNAVAPGVIDTPFVEAIPGSESLVERIPLGRFGRPDDVAETIAFLASDAAGYITGEIIDVNGGLLMD